MAHKLQAFPHSCLSANCCCFAQQLVILYCTATVQALTALLLVSSRQTCLACPAEIEFWRVRNAAFSSLYEQLNLPSVKKYVSVLEAGSADQNLLTSFKAQFNELKKVGIDLQSVVVFLTLEWVLTAMSCEWL